MPLKQSGRGFNLLECVIAATIFSGTVLLFLGVWTNFYAAQAKSRNRLAATSLARGVLEQRIAAGFAASPPGDYPVETVALATQIRGKDLETVLTYQFYSEDTTPPGAPANSYRKLEVVVRWEDSRGGPQRVKYATHLYRTN
jgi:type II secretory pathway pseudopilin PulG